jgi:predicted RNase H-like HicB family nuclease
MAVSRPLIIHAEWDDEAGVWVATSEDVPGLATEAESMDALVAKLQVMVPELLDANGYADGDLDHDVRLRVLSSLDTIAHRRAA